MDPKYNVLKALHCSKAKYKIFVVSPYQTNHKYGDNLNILFMIGNKKYSGLTLTHSYVTNTFPTIF